MFKFRWLLLSIRSLFTHPHDDRTMPDAVQYSYIFFSSHLYLSFKRKMNQFTKNSKSLHFVLSSTSSNSIRTETHTKKGQINRYNLYASKKKKKWRLNLTRHILFSYSLVYKCVQYKLFG